MRRELIEAVVELWDVYEYFNEAGFKTSEFVILEPSTIMPSTRLPVEWEQKRELDLEAPISFIKEIANNGLLELGETFNNKGRRANWKILILVDEFERILKTLKYGRLSLTARNLAKKLVQYHTNKKMPWSVRLIRIDGDNQVSGAMFMADGLENLTAEEFSSINELKSFNLLDVQVISETEYKIDLTPNILDAVDNKFTEEKEPVTNLASNLNHQERDKHIFIVHGHDDEMKQTVARTIEKLGLIPIILHEQENKGQTTIEKFEANSDVGFAVVLLSPDDRGFAWADGQNMARPRARQNVILELGYFLGKLGRARVLALYKAKDDFEIPSDYAGVLYVRYDGDNWKLELVKELKASGYDVDANLLF